MDGEGRVVVSDHDPYAAIRSLIALPVAKATRDVSFWFDGADFAHVPEEKRAEIRKHLASVVRTAEFWANSDDEEWDTYRDEIDAEIAASRRRRGH